LNRSEKAFLFDIEPYVNFETNIIVDEVGIAMTQEQLGKLTGWGKSQVSEIVSSLVKKNVLFEIKKGKTKYYGVNHKYYECGNWDKLLVQSAFSEFQSAGSEQ